MLGSSNFLMKNKTKTNSQHSNSIVCKPPNFLTDVINNFLNLKKRNKQNKWEIHEKLESRLRDYG